MEKIKDRIAEALRVKQMKPVDLARKSGINKGTISKYLKGDYLPKQNNIGAIAKALDVSPAWLMGYDLTMDGKELPTDIEIQKLSPENKARLLAYYQALIDSQEDNNGNT